MTELEFRAARHLGHPMLIFLLGENHPVRKADVEQDPEKIPKLAAFRNEVKRAAENSPLHLVYREFDGLHEFEVAATQAIAELRRHLDQLAAAVPTRPIRRPSAYLRQVQRIAPPELVGRDDELAELTTFCLAPDPAPAPDTDRPDAECARIEQQYRWWRAPAWSGKSALMSTFVLHPPAALRGRVRIVSFFITARLAAQDTHTAFATTLVQQLADLLGQDPPSALTETDRDEHLLDLLDQAAHSCNAWVSGWCWSWTDSTKTAV